ncbi:MAG TPA: O-antigen ligase family protein [Thermoanaerobaculia bacterium]
MQRSIAGVGERLTLGLLLAWLLWLPMPFGSVVEAARAPLILVPLVLCAAAALLRLQATRGRTSDVHPTRAFRIWAVGGFLFVAVCTLQIVPLSKPLLQAASPESVSIWTMASRVASLAGVSPRTAFPITIDPATTALELLRMLALLATFAASALLIRNHSRRTALAAALGLSALFQMFYGVRAAAAGGRYAIWGWPNTLIHDRVTGTYVNPNHFAHYLALVLPVALFLAAVAWHETPPTMPILRRLALIFERRMVLVGFSLIVAIGCFAAILVAQSRGGLLAATAGLLLSVALAPGRRGVKLAVGAAATLLLLAGLVAFLGTERTIARFRPNSFEQATLVGRVIGIQAAAGIWQRFPIFGSGLGTFEQVVSIEQRADLDKIYHHAHNDYMELAATSGTLGFIIAFVTLAGGYVALYRTTWRRDPDLTWRRRAFQAAALASLTIALVHALFDFNFFIPANPATLAAILGAAVAVHDHDKRSAKIPVRAKPEGER